MQGSVYVNSRSALHATCFFSLFYTNFIMSNWMSRLRLRTNSSPDAVCLLPLPLRISDFPYYIQQRTKVVSKDIQFL